MKRVMSTLSVVMMAGIILSACENGSSWIGLGPDERRETGQQAVEQGQQSDNEKGEAVMREDLPQLLLNQQFEQIYRQTGQEFREAVTYDQFRLIAAQFVEDVTSFSLQSKLTENGLDMYVWIDQSSTKGMMAAFDQTGTIVGLQVNRLQSYPDTDAALTQTEYRLPFQGEWMTYWGGRNVLVNYHYAYPGQRYAYDFIIVKDGMSYQGDPTHNESYHAFGQEVLAPASGTVVQVVNDVPDNEPVGEMNEEQPAGNYVVIDHGRGEYSLLAHFQHQSIRVKPGDVVEAGDLLGLCGNSGNSSEPHIHFHVADDADLVKGRSLRIRLSDGLDPLRGQVVAP
ncbi:M23 family metallopeptidase [Brevibacillus humidisoli]|uniref:M23 family metallopeptidase n=1 Tax=Brevibacillus humidisoli TaxID=2895522 RepID=UPI001E506F39|nr:M23 family metallopeptidase [Brevibacillus humidisoli]UFJ40268.1 M23 family metallopeptidase [Brevibacillus humidisoli]